MNKINSSIVVLLLPALIYCQSSKTLNIDTMIGTNSNNGRYGTIEITPENFIIEIKPYYCTSCAYFVLIK